MVPVQGIRQRERLVTAVPDTGRQAPKAELAQPLPLLELTGQLAA